MLAPKRAWSAPRTPATAVGAGTPDSSRRFPPLQLPLPYSPPANSPTSNFGSPTRCRTGNSHWPSVWRDQKHSSLIETLCHHLVTTRCCHASVWSLRYRTLLQIPGAPPTAQTTLPVHHQRARNSRLTHRCRRPPTSLSLLPPPRKRPLPRASTNLTAAVAAAAVAVVRCRSPPLPLPTCAHAA